MTSYRPIEDLLFYVYLFATGPEYTRKCNEAGYTVTNVHREIKDKKSY